MACGMHQRRRRALHPLAAALLSALVVFSPTTTFPPAGQQGPGSTAPAAAASAPAARSSWRLGLLAPASAADAQEKHVHEDKEAADGPTDDYDYDYDYEDDEEAGNATATAKSGGSAACAPPYKGFVEFGSASCKAHRYTPGLFKMFTDERTRQMGQSYVGDRTRLLAALQRFRDGGNLTIGVIGGSISAGQGAFDAPAYPYWMQYILEQQLPDGISRVRINNGAVPGTSSQYMSTCIRVHLPKNVDIVIVEYACNDEEMPMPHMNNQVRRPYEKLIRKILQYPNRPAVILLHAYRWFQIPVDATSHFWANSERQQGEFGMYYGLPQLSIKSCCYHHMRKGKEGFLVTRPRADPHGKLQPEIDHDLKGRVFYFDIVHPDGNTGHRILGELSAQIIMDAWAQVASGESLTKEDEERMREPLPPPMLPNNRESLKEKCFIGPAFQDTVVKTDGFKWVNEGKTAALPKWGYVADSVGNSIQLRINTNSGAASKEAEATVGTDAAAKWTGLGMPAATAASNLAEVTMELGYLRSYENMGRAMVNCSGGCRCTAWTLDGHHEARNSQTFLASFKVTQADECIVTVQILQQTSSGKHKVKLTGIMVTEEPEAAPFNNWAAFDWVNIAAAKSADGVFEIKNVARRHLMAAQRAVSQRVQQRYSQELLRDHERRRRASRRLAGAAEGGAVGQVGGGRVAEVEAMEAEALAVGIGAEEWALGGAWDVR